MMSCTMSAAWSRPVSSPCCTEHGQRRGAVLSGRIAISSSGQLGLRCTVEPNCSGMSTRLAGALVTRDRALETCEPSCVPGATRPFFIPVVHSPLGAAGYVAAPELSSQGGRARSHGTRGSARAHLDREARSGAEEHVAASELNSRGGEVRGHVVASEPTSAGRRGLELRNTWQRRSSTQQGGEATGHVAAPEPTSAGR
jgi:hypothetical protein